MDTIRQILGEHLNEINIADIIIDYKEDIEYSEKLEHCEVIRKEMIDHLHIFISMGTIYKISTIKLDNFKDLYKAIYSVAFGLDVNMVVEKHRQIDTIRKRDIRGALREMTHILFARYIDHGIFFGDIESIEHSNIILEELTYNKEMYKRYLT